MKKTIHQIPVIEYDNKDLKSYKGIVFLVHGHTGTKELGNLEVIPIGFQERGYFVVSLDAYKHGERKQDPYFSNDALAITLEMPKVILHTIQDIVWLYHNVYSEISQNVIVSGISMGGHIAFQMPKYLKETKMIIPLIGSPDIWNHYHFTKKAFLKENVELANEDLKELKIEDLTDYMNVKIAAFNGAMDDVVETRFVKPFIEKLIALNHSCVHFESFDSRHEVTPSIVEAMFRFFDSACQ